MVASYSREQFCRRPVLSLLTCSVLKLAKWSKSSRSIWPNFGGQLYHELQCLVFSGASCSSGHFCRSPVLFCSWPNAPCLSILCGLRYVSSWTACCQIYCENFSLLRRAKFFDKFAEIQHSAVMKEPNRELFTENCSKSKVFCLSVGKVGQARPVKKKKTVKKFSNLFHFKGFQTESEMWERQKEG